MTNQPIFVFGSNLAGRHGKGAALTAAKLYGAEYGVAEGRTGNAYAIPTKDQHLAVLPLSRIAGSIVAFLDYAHEHPQLTFHLTPVGCGLAGYSRAEIGAIFRRRGVPRNVFLTSTWVTP